MVSLEKKRKPVNLTKEKAPHTPEAVAEIHDERSVEERIRAVTEKLQDDVVYSTKEQDDALLEEWDTRNTTESADALRRSIAADRDALSLLPDHPNILPSTQAPIPGELRSYLQAGDSFIEGAQIQQANNRAAYEAAQTALQKDNKQRRLKNILSFGIGAKRRNQHHKARVEAVESRHAEATQRLAHEERRIRNSQLETVAQHRAALETKIRSTDLMANARESAATHSDKTFEEDFTELEQRVQDTIKLSRESGDLKQAEVITQLQTSAEFAAATPSEQEELLHRCESLVQEAAKAEEELIHATVGMKLKKLVRHRMSSKSPAGGELNMKMYSGAANYLTGGDWNNTWQPERVDALAQEMVKFGLDQGITVANLSPDTIIKLATTELKQAQEARVANS